MNGPPRYGRAGWLFQLLKLGSEQLSSQAVKSNPAPYGVRHKPSSPLDDLS
jgi:hypothetical protein